MDRDKILYGSIIVVSFTDAFTTILSHSDMTREFSPLGRIFLQFNDGVAFSLMFLYTILLFKLYKFIGERYKHFYVYGTTGIILAKLLASINNFLIFKNIFIPYLILPSLIFLVVPPIVGLIKDGKKEPFF